MDVKPLYIYPNKTRIRLFFFSGFLFWGVSALLIYFGVYFWAYFLFFAGLFNLGMNFRKAFLNGPVLVVNKEGIQDYMNFPQLGFIPWDNIQKAEFGKITGIDHILVYLHNPDKYIAEQSFVKRPFMKSNQEQIGTCIIFRTNVFPDKKQQVLNLINQLAQG